VSAAERSVDGPDGGPISPVTGALMALVGIIAFSALMVMLAYGPSLRTGRDGQAHVLSHSAVGFAGLAQALRAAGEPVVINRRPLPGGRRGSMLIIAPRGGLLIVTPTIDQGWKEIDALGGGAPELIVLPKWLVAPDATHPGWVSRLQVIDPRTAPRMSLLRNLHIAHRQGRAAPRLRALDTPFTAGETFAAAPIEALQSARPLPGWRALITDETGATLLARAPDRPLYILSDPDLLNTQGLKSEQGLATALVLARGLRGGAGPFVFDVRLNGLGGGRSALRLLLEPPFLGVTLCLAAAAGLAGLTCRFGPPRRRQRAIALGKVALIDNTAALVRMAGREHRMGGRYAELTADLAARAVGAPRGLDEAALTAFLDRLAAGKASGGEAPADTLAELGLQSRMAQSTARMLALARRLRTWRLAVTGEAATTAPASAAEAEALDHAPGNGLGDASVPDPASPRRARP
jgi:hypothetical protein